MTGPMVTPDRETLAKAECPDCGHSPFEHHITGGCSVITYGMPEDGFEPREACDCDENADGALLASGAVTTAADAVRAWAEQIRALGVELIQEGDKASLRKSYTEGTNLRYAGNRVLALAAALGGES